MLHKPLLTMQAGDLMTKALVLVPKDMSLAGAARLMFKAGVTGAPVVDEEGCCIGVISTTDFMRLAGGEQCYCRAQGIAPPQSPYMAAWQILDQDKPAQDRVMDYMTRDPVTVATDANIGQLARMMLDAHIHRVIIVDDRKRPVGIVSATDLLAALSLADQQKAECHISPGATNRFEPASAGGQHHA